MFDLTGKTALVTGATSGIGKAAAFALAAAGATVAVSGRDKDRGQAVVDAIDLPAAPPPSLGLTSPMPRRPPTLPYGPLKRSAAK